MRLSVVAAVACLTIVGLSAAEESQATIRKDTNIAAQALRPALQQFSRQRDLQLVYRTDVVGDLQTQGAVGDLTIEEALTALLSGTGLTYSFLDDKTITILPIVPAGAPGTAREDGASPALGAEGDTAGQRARADSSLNGGKKSFWSRLLLAQAASTSASGSSQTDSSDPSSATSASKSIESTDSSRTIEEVIVTAEKREQRLHEVPMSIVALRGEDLDAQGILGLSDLAMSVPGLAAWDAGGYGFRQLYMRGVGNVRGSSSLLGIYVDDASVVGTNSYQLDLRIYDLERVEVLRGPQGTLYGDGSMGGTVRFITRNPDLDEFGGKAELSSAFTEGGSSSQTVRGIVNVPLMDDRLGARVAATYQNTGGWIDQAAVGREDINDEELVNVRVKMLWEPIDDLSVAGAVIMHRNDAGALDTGEESPGASYRQSFGRPTTPSGIHDYDFYSLTLNYDFGSAKLTSATGYLDHLNRFEEYGYRIPLLGPRTEVDPFDVLLGLDGGWDRNVTGLTQELRLSSLGERRTHWTVGLFYRDSEAHEVGQGMFGPFPLATDNSIDSESWTAFGQVAHSVTERLELGVGASYFEDRRSEADTLTGVSGSMRFHSTNPRFFVSYDLTSDIKTYGSVAKGFRSGGFNVVGAAEGFPPYEPDSIWSYEIGTKMSLLEGRLALEAALFYSDYSDIQINSVQLAPDGASFVQYAANSGDAEIRGVDWDLTYLMSGGISVGLSGEYVDTEIVKIFNAVSASHAVGDPLDEIPDHHLGAWVAYEFPWFDGSHGYTRLMFNHQGQSQIIGRTVGPWFGSSSDEIDMLDATVGWKGKRFAVDLVGRNLLNERGYQSANWRDQVAARARPRTYGVNVMLNFE